MCKKPIQFVSFLIVVLIVIFLPAAAEPPQASAQAPFVSYLPFFTRYQSPYYLDGLDGGTIEGIVIDPNDPNILYAGSWGNGIYKSTDGGTTWVNKNKGLHSPYIYEIAIDPKDNQHILVSAYEHGINQSFDGGESWTDVSSDIPTGSVIYSIDFHPLNSSIVYAAVREPTIVEEGVPDYPGGVYKSFDGGSKWEKKSNGMANDYVYDLGIDPNDPNTIYAAMHDTGVYKTSDAGNTWVEKVNWLIHRDIRSVAINPNTSRVYVGHWDGFGFSYLDKGSDSWVNVTSTYHSDLYVYEVLLDPHKLNTVYLSTYTGLYRCVNPSHGSSCELIAHDDILVFDVAIDYSSGIDPSSGFTKGIYTGLQYCALHKSEDAGETFDPIYQGIRANIVNSLIIHPYYPAIQYLSIYGRGIFKSKDNGTTWEPIRTLPIGKFINEIAFRPEHYRIIYAVADWGGIFWSTDAGNTWNMGYISANLEQEWQTIPGESDLYGLFDSSVIYSWMDPIDQQEMQKTDDRKSNTLQAASVTPNFTSLSFSPEPGQMIAGTSNKGISKSDDYGLNWFSVVPTPLPKPVYDTITDASQAPYLYFIGLQDYGVMCAKEDRLSWESRNSGLHPSADVFSLEMVGAGFYYAGTDNGIYRTTDGGLEWVFVGLPGKQVNDILVDTTQTSIIYAATNQGLYQSVDGGSHWKKRPVSGLFNQNLIMLTQIPGSSDLYIGTDGGDMVRWTN